MALNKETSGSFNKYFILMGIIFLAILVGLFFYFRSGSSIIKQPSDYNALNTINSNSSQNSQETAAYNKKLEQYNQQQAQQAEKTGSSYVAPIKINNQTVATQKTSQQPKKPVKIDETSTPTTPVIDNSNNSEGGDQQNNSVNALAKAINDRDTASQMQVATAQGVSSNDKVNTYAGWVSSVEPLAQANQPTNTKIAPTTLISANTKIPAIIETAIDSDNLNSIVLATVPSGKFQGAQLSAQGIALVGDGISIHFTQMTFNGQSYTVNAYALDDATLQSSVASSVDHHYLSRIVLPAVAGGIANVGELYQNANTQVVSNNNSTVTATGEPTKQMVTGVMVGGVAKQTGTVLNQQAQKLPATEVTVNQGKLVAVLFLTPVVES